jgi:hypothetical protein
MKKIAFLLPLTLVFAGVHGVAEAKPWVSGPGGGDFINVPRRKKRCTFKRPCSRMPELPYFGTPMPRGFKNR